MQSSSVIIRTKIIITLVLALTFLILPACNRKVHSEQQEKTVLATEFGDATFYSRSFQGDKTASGERFDNRKAVAAHRSYPFGTTARVTNLENGRVATVVIVDRGPYAKNRREGTIIDLSRAAAESLGFT